MESIRVASAGGGRLVSILGAAALLLLAGGARLKAQQSEIASPAGDPVAGLQTFFTWCAACHYADKGAPSIVAPNLFDVFERPAGQLDDFYGYSDQMLRSGIVWTEETLNTWLQGPVKMMPGTLMEFAGLEAADRANVIAFLKQNR